MTTLSPRELLVFTATPVKKKPAPKRLRVSVAGFNLDCALARQRRESSSVVSHRG